ncbi:MAG: thioredoxin family protein [Actinomycetes bacterium]
MNPGVVILVVALVAATVFALWRRRTDGRLRAPRGAVEALAIDGESRPNEGASSAAFPTAELGITLGPRATLVQFSTAFCQPCRATRRVLAEIAELVDGVAAVEVDAEAHLDVVRELNVMRTPTVFVLDGSGQVRQRASGQPRKADVIAAIGALERGSQGPVPGGASEI